MDNPRPDSITILGTLEIFLSVLAGLGALIVALVNAFGSLGFVIFCLFGFVWLVSGLGFLYGKHWAWSCGMVTATLSLVGSFFLSFFFVLRLLFGPGLIIWPVVIYLLTQPRVKSYFGRTSSSAKAALASGPRQK